MQFFSWARTYFEGAQNSLPSSSMTNHLPNWASNVYQAVATVYTNVRDKFPDIAITNHSRWNALDLLAASAILGIAYYNFIRLLIRVGRGIKTRFMSKQERAAFEQERAEFEKEKAEFEQKKVEFKEGINEFALTGQALVIYFNGFLDRKESNGIKDDVKEAVRVIINRADKKLDDGQRKFLKF